MRDLVRIDGAEVGRTVCEDGLRSVGVFIVVSIIVGDDLRIIRNILEMCKDFVRQVMGI